MFNEPEVRKAIWRSRMTTTEKLTLLVLSHIADESGRSTFSYQNIATAIGASERTAVRVVKALVQDNGGPVVLRRIRAENGCGANAYELSLRG